MTRIPHRRWARAMSLLLALCALLPLIQPRANSAAMSASAPATDGTRSREWPSAWEGRRLRPLALGAVEQRFASRFPGSIARFSDDAGRVLVMRRVARPTRMLHPAADCYRGLGYRIEQARLERDAQQRLWRCFAASKADSQALRVCERIEDARGGAYTDASAWFWAASMGQSLGPWQAVTVVEAR